MGEQKGPSGDKNPFRFGDNVLHFSQALAPATGLLMISAPNLLDPNFKRRVVLLCEHSTEGSFGLVVNQPLPMRLSDVVELKGKLDLPLYQGGPVQSNTLHFIHTRRDQAKAIGSREIAPELFWGGDFDKVLRLLEKGQFPEKDIRFFAGYAGWSKTQLEDEMKQHSWYVAKASREFLFTFGEEEVWRDALRSLGQKYEILFHYPDDPTLN